VPEPILLPVASDFKKIEVLITLKMLAF
jgi:hypothetical protein